MKHLAIHTIILLIFCHFGVNGQNNQVAPPRFSKIKFGMILDKPPFEQCHASTIVSLNRRTLMAAFFGGSYESAKDVKIWGSVFKRGYWSKPFILADGRIHDTLTFPCWNPVLFKSSKGILYLFYKVGKNPREWFGMMKSSPDNGVSWSEPVRLPEGVLGPVRNKPVELRNGKLLCPSSTETDTQWKAQMEIFDPANNTWQITKVDQESDYQVIQPTILNGEDSTFRILCRSKSNSVITSLSADNGKTWSPFSPLNLPNPNSGIDGLTLPDDSHLLVYNPLLSGKEWVNGRNQLNLAWSADGLNWQDILTLEREETGEFSYPAIIRAADNRIYITYTYNRVQIKYWVIK